MTVIRKREGDKGGCCNPYSELQLEIERVDQTAIEAKTTANDTEAYLNTINGKVNEAIAVVPQVQTNTQNIAQHESRINSNTTDINKNKIDIQEQGNDIAALKTKTNDNAFAIENLENKTEQNKINIQKQGNDITALNTKTNNNASAIENLENETGQNKIKIQEQGNDIAALKTKTNNNASAIENLKNETGQNKIDIQEQGNDIAALNTKANDNAAAIEALENEVGPETVAGTIQYRLKDIDTKLPTAIKEVEMIANASTVTHKATHISGTAESDALPVVSREQAGIMSASVYAAMEDVIANNTSRISVLEQSAPTYDISGLVGPNPTNAEISAAFQQKYPTVPIQAGLRAADYDNAHFWQYGNNTWILLTQIDVQTATNQSLGVVKGSNTDGKIFVETDGSMSLKGYDALVSKNATHDSKISTLEVGLGNANARIDATNTNVANNAADIVAANGNISTNTNDINGLKGRMTTAEGQIATHETTINQHTESINGLSTDISGLNDRMSTDEGQIATHETTINQHTESINGLSDDISGLDGRMTTAEGKISANETKINQQTQSISELSNDISGLKDRMSTAEGQITTHETTINQHTQSINGLSTDVNGLKTDVNGLKTDVNGLSTDVNGLNTDVNGLKTSKQDKLTAGTGITIDNNVISAQNGSIRRVVEGKNAMLEEFRKFMSQGEVGETYEIMCRFPNSNNDWQNGYGPYAGNDSFFIFGNKNGDYMRITAATAMTIVNRTTWLSNNDITMSFYGKADGKISGSSKTDTGIVYITSHGDNYTIRVYRGNNASSSAQYYVPGPISLGLDSYTTLHDEKAYVNYAPKA